MLWIAVTLAISAPTKASSAAMSRVERVQISARLLRGAEANKRGKAAHEPKRIRILRETLTNGQEVELTILDFE